MMLKEPSANALMSDDFREEKVDQRLDLVGAENRREVRSGRCRTVGKSVTGALAIGPVEPSGHLGAGKPAADGLGEGRAIEPRLTQAGTGRKFAAGAAFAQGAMALKTSGLVPSCL